ncbi:MAG: O-methyltransferase [Clostridiales bacterium]|nr:O-methyltransferase [Clostridiales bacterium]
MIFDYAHKDTSEGERQTCTAQFNNIILHEEVEKLRAFACEREIPVSDRETLTFLSTLLSAMQPQKILEVGTAVGVSAAAMLSVCKNAHITTIEKREEFVVEAAENFKKLGISSQITQISGDAGEKLSTLEGQFDFIFLDSAKVQYVKYLPDLKRLLKPHGVLLADDILLFGYVTGESPVPPKRRMLVEHIKEYISAVTSDNELTTTIINLGNGLALSVKK